MGDQASKYILKHTCEKKSLNEIMKLIITETSGDLTLVILIFLFFVKMNQGY